MYKARVANCADRIGEALKEKGMRPSALCKMAKIPQSSLSLYLSGAYEPKQDRVYAMAAVLNVDVSWLLGYDVPMGTFAENLVQLDAPTVELVSIDLNEGKKKEYLTQKENQLIELFRLLTEEEQDHILQSAKMIAK